jgi:hypothetical protein
MIFHSHLHPYFSTWRRRNRHLATVASFVLSGRKCYTCIPIWSSICNLVIVYICIDNQCLTFPWFGFSPWLFDTIQTDSLCTLLFFLWVQRCIGLDLEMVNRLLKWTETCVWRVIFVRGPTTWDASFWSGRNSGKIVVLGLILFIYAVSYGVIVLNINDS